MLVSNDSSSFNLILPPESNTNESNTKKQKGIKDYYTILLDFRSSLDFFRFCFKQSGCEDNCENLFFHIIDFNFFLCLRFSFLALPFGYNSNYAS